MCIRDSPKIVPSAKKLSYITYDELMELAFMGAKVVHFRAVEIAKKFNVELYSTSAHSDERRTYVVNTSVSYTHLDVYKRQGKGSKLGYSLS